MRLNGCSPPRSLMRSKASASAFVNSAVILACAINAANDSRPMRGFSRNPVDGFGFAFPRPCVSLQFIRYSAISPTVQPTRPPRLRAGGKFPRSIRERTAFGLFDRITATSSTNRKSLSGKRLRISAMYEEKSIKMGNSGADDTIRTCDFHLRRVALYPTELHPRCTNYDTPKPAQTQRTATLRNQNSFPYMHIASPIFPHSHEELRGKARQAMCSCH